MKKIIINEGALNSLISNYNNYSLLDYTDYKRVIKEFKKAINKNYIEGNTTTTINYNCKANIDGKNAIYTIYLNIYSDIEIEDNNINIKPFNIKSIVYKQSLECYSTGFNSSLYRTPIINYSGL